jgi:DNA-binding Lrp family transcriptional regulator
MSNLRPRSLRRLIDKVERAGAIKRAHAYSDVPSIIYLRAERRRRKLMAPVVRIITDGAPHQKTELKEALEKIRLSMQKTSS